MDFRSIFDHELMYFTTKQRVPAKLEWLSETRFVNQEVKTLIRTIVLLILAVAVILVCLADCLRQNLADMLRDLVLGSRVKLCAHGTEEGFDEVVKPAEGSVIAYDLAVVVPLNPCVYGDGDN